MSITSIKDIDGTPIVGMNVRLSIGNANSDAAYDDRFTDYSGNTAWPHPLPSHDGYNLHVNYQNVNPEWNSKSVKVDNIDSDVNIVLTRNIRNRAAINGFYSNVFFKGESAFLDLARLCHGQDIRPLCRQSVALGSNGRRGFLMTFNTAMAAGLPPFDPDDFSNYYDKIEELLQIYADYGIYLYSAVFPDNQLFPNWKGNNQKQIDHWNRIGTIAQRYTNWWGLELTNEPDAHPFNQVATEKFSRIPGVISCSGSMGDTGGSPMREPQWDVCDYHSPRHYPNEVVDMCVANHPSRVQRGKAILLGEPLGFGNVPNRERNPRIAKEMAGSARGTSCGVVFHSQSGGFSQTYNQVELDCATAWFNELIELKGT